VKSFFGTEVGYTLSAGFDGEGVARVLLGQDPLNVILTFERLAEGDFGVEMKLSELRP